MMKSAISSRPSPLRNSRGNESQMSLMNFREDQSLAASAGLETPPLTSMPFGTSERDVPEGQMKISPAFQRWDACDIRKSPERTAERRQRYQPVHVQPSLRDSNSVNHNPGVETPGYYRDVPPGQMFIEFPKGITHNPALLLGW